MADISKSKFCRNCGARIRADEIFCPFCGTDASSKIYCSACGSANRPEQAFCEHCGASLKTDDMKYSQEEPQNHVPQDDNAKNNSSKMRTAFGVLLGISACLILVLFAMKGANYWSTYKGDQAEEEITMQEADKAPDQDEAVSKEQMNFVSDEEPVEVEPASPDVAEEEYTEKSIFGMLLADAQNAKMIEFNAYSDLEMGESNVAGILVPEAWLGQELYGFRNSYCRHGSCAFHFYTTLEAEGATELFSLYFDIDQRDNYNQETIHYMGTITTEIGQMFHAYVRVPPPETLKRNLSVEGFHSIEEVDALREFLEEEVLPTFSLRSSGWYGISNRYEELYTMLLQEKDETNFLTWNFLHSERSYMDGSIQVPARWLQNEQYGFSEYCCSQNNRCSFKFESTCTAEYGTSAYLFEIEYYYLQDSETELANPGYCCNIVAGDGKTYGVCVSVTDGISGAEELREYLIQNVVPSFSGLTAHQ